MIDKKFTKSGGTTRMDFQIDKIRANMGTVVSFRDTLPRQAVAFALALTVAYQERYNRSIALKVIKTDNIPMGIRKGQVLVQIGFQDVYNSETDMNSAKHFVELFNQGDLNWIEDFIFTQFPSIDISSVQILNTKV